MVAATTTPESSPTSTQRHETTDNEIVNSSATALCGSILPDTATSPILCGDNNFHLKDLLPHNNKEGGGIMQHLKMKRHHENTIKNSASLYDESLYSFCGESDIDKDTDTSSNEQQLQTTNDAILQQPIPASDISNPNRTICIVTTAAMPWRTGTAVNPLLRALYLIKYQNEAKVKEEEKDQKDKKEKEQAYYKIVEPGILQQSSSKVAADESSTGAVSSSEDTKQHKKKGGSVVLVIPWLEAEEDRIKLYGTSNSFSNSSQQEEWIRNYSATNCKMPKEAQQLIILWYPAFYLAGFGSIFPKVDLCNFIPSSLNVDVVILEEPEHLNWFRMPEKNSKKKKDTSSDENEEEDELQQQGEKKEEGVELIEQLTISESGESTNDIIAQPSQEQPSSHTTSTATPEEDTNVANSSSNNNNLKKLGWTHRFNFVVGIVHTNYEAYARQYGIGASLIAAPAIGALSALCMRAYCHQIIKLSDTLPCLAPGKEVTENVHGVRSEFLDGIDLNILAGNTKAAVGEGEEDDAPSPVYFIGKLVWAKGFDLMLELQDIFRKKNGDYFHVDIYGGGPDEKAIARAFHGRHHTAPTKRPISTSKESSGISPTSSRHPSMTDLQAAAVLDNPQSIKDQSNQVVEQMKRLSMDGDDVVSQYLSLGFEVTQMNGSATYVKESRKGLMTAPSEVDNEEAPDDKNPLNILGDLSGKAMDTGGKTSKAVYNIADQSIKNILTMSFSQLKDPLKAIKKKREEKKEQKQQEREAAAKEAAATDKEESAEEEEEKPAKFVFDPPASRYEWRRHTIPAKFPGVVDHVELKNMPYKIFLNPSTSEVLCTTTTEALAMNKFVIIPKHPSNDFFMQFTNCLSYDTLEECAEKMAWALENTPTTMCEEERRKVTWEGATERLIKSSIVTVGQSKERFENGMDKNDARVAYWLSESGEKSNMIRNLFPTNNK